MLTPETVLQSRYRIIRQLGQGGMGAVYEAMDERLDTTIALKETLFSDERLRKQFEREARLLARMHHPALPRVSDHFSESEGQFLVMQYIPGEDLSEMIAKRRGPFPHEQVMSWADQLLDALDYLHTQEPQIIHRDIKPQNLKLTARGQIILLDFGLAKGQASEVSRVTTSASIFGYTPNYAPLEQIQGLGTDPRSDIYSLSATLYHLATGVKPPDALSRAAAIINGQPDPLLPANEVNGAVSVETAKVLERAMAQNREQRYPNAAAMRRALQGTEDATISNRSEANTVLFPPAAPLLADPTVVNVTQPTVHAVGTPATLAPGETTVVRGSHPAARRTPTWLFPTAALALLLVGAACFYAYRNFKSAASDGATPTAAASPTAAPASGAVNEVKVADDAEKSETAKSQPDATPEKAQSDSASNDRAAKERADADKEKKSADKQKEKSTEGGSRQDPGEVTVEIPDPPQIDVPDVPARGRRGSVRRVGGVTIRNFPDGSQLITNPDGSRVLIRPDGTRQFISGPNQQNPRRNPPRPQNPPD